MGDDKPNFSGKYQHIKSENFEDFLRENGRLSLMGSERKLVTYGRVFQPVDVC